jgi:predicted nucleic-acid-binding protein
MIAADTNLIVRHLTHDDARQTPVVERLFGEAEARGEPIFLGHVVLAELCWVLGAVYRFPKVEIANALQSLLDDSAFLVEERPLVEEALASFRRGSAGFSDYLVGAVARRAGASATLTFDRRLGRAPGFALAR